MSNEPQRRKRTVEAVITSVAVGFAGIALAGAPAHADDSAAPLAPAAVEQAWPDDYEHPTSARLVGQLTGERGFTNTVENGWRVEGTDLGIMWDNGAGEILFAIGDTFGNWSGNGGGGSDWRSNAVLRSSNDDWKTEGIQFDSAAGSETEGYAKEIIPSKKISGDEMTTIPTGAIAVGGRQYLSFMSVNTWGPGGQWHTNYSRIAYSDDNGETWNSTDGPQWDNTDKTLDGNGNHIWDDTTTMWNQKFQMVAFAQKPGDTDVYMFGTANGRIGGLYVAKVPQDKILEKDAYRYWDGSAWIEDDAAAAEVAPAPVSELSVQYNTYLNKWMAMYNTDSADGTAYEVVYRLADSPEGPWSESTAVATSWDLAGFYSPYMHPWNDGPEIHFSLSIWGPYNVFQYAFTVDEEGNLINPNIVRDPDFRRSEPGKISEAWNCTGNCGIDVRGAQRWGFAGDNQLWMRQNAGSTDASQAITVDPNSRYLVTAFLTTGTSFTGDTSGQGEIGIRGVGSGATTVEKVDFTDPGKWTRYQFEFESDWQTNLEFYVNSTYFADRWVQFSDVSVVKIGEVEPPETIIDTLDEPVLIASETCDVEATVDIPENIEGVNYESSREGNTVTVTAKALEGYIFAEELVTVWTFDVTATPCGPDNAKASISTNVAKAKPGDKVTVTGKDFTPNTAVTIELRSKVATLGQVTTDANGFFTLEVAIPTNVSPGKHQIAAVYDGKDILLPFEVLAVSAGGENENTNPAGGNSNSGLATTGTAGLAALITAGIALAGVGLWIRRRSSVQG